MLGEICQVEFFMYLSERDSTLTFTSNEMLTMLKYLFEGSVMSLWGIWTIWESLNLIPTNYELGYKELYLI